METALLKNKNGYHRELETVFNSTEANFRRNRKKTKRKEERKEREDRKGRRKGIKGRKGRRRLAQGGQIWTWAKSSASAGRRMRPGLGEGGTEFPMTAWQWL